MNGFNSPDTLRKKPWDIKQPELSFEFYPARTSKMVHTLWRAMGQLELLNPAFFSMTYGALGSARDDSINVVATMSQQQSVPVAAHLTCSGHTREYMLELAHHFHDEGIQRIAGNS